MPTYDYKCTQCGHSFEKFQRMSESPIEICPSCGGKVKRVVTGGVGVVFKGSGFHSTDYRTCENNSKGGTPPCGSCCSDGTCGIH